MPIVSTAKVHKLYFEHLFLIPLVYFGRELTESKKLIAVGSGTYMPGISVNRTFLVKKWIFKAKGMYFVIVF